MPVKAKYRADCYALAKAYLIDQTENRIPIRMTFYPPANRGDLDNMLASTKSGLDGIAEAWQINDKQFRPITIDVGQADKTNPRVEIRIETDHIRQG